MKFSFTLIATFLSIHLIFSQSKTIDTISIKSPIYKKSLSHFIRTKDEMERSSSISILDELSKIPNVNIQSRGLLGAQADISMRGGTYEQVAILFNGIKINNPQTGHNNMVFPIPFDFLDQIEVVQSGASKYYGANAYTGAIELSTSKPTKTKLMGNLSVGSFQTVSSSVLYDVVKEKHWHKVGLSYIHSNGYRANTDNNTIQFYNENHFALSKDNLWQAHATIGIHSKQFGANGFYSLRFPNQYEELQSYFYNIGIKNDFFKLNFFWNQTNDYYILKREEPTFYENRHYTDVRGTLITFEKSLTKAISITSNLEAKNEHIKSSNLGIRSRNILNGNAHLGLKTKNIYLNLGGNLNYIEKFSPFLTGGANVVYHINKQHTVFSSINSSFRIPTFTELYYTSPTDTGNQNLKPEEALTIDLGYQYKSSYIDFAVKAYSRWSTNQIDWIRTPSTSSYYSNQNISKIQNQGLEINFKSYLNKILLAKPLQYFEISYVHNTYSFDSISNTKYSLTLLKNQLTSSLSLQFGKRFYHSFQLRVEDRANLNYLYAILDSKTEYKLDKIPASFYIQVYNITNSRYENFNGIELPRIHFLTGCKFTL